MRIIGGRVAAWSEAELQALRDAYSKQYADEVNLTELSDRLGRHKTNVCRKARALGLTNQQREMTREKKRRRKYDTDEERWAAWRKKWSQHLAEHGHPKGALGMKHSAETKQKISESTKQSWRDPESGHNAPDMPERRAERIYQRVREGKHNKQTYTRCAGGKRADLGNTYFRSSWEANYARYLNWLKEIGEITGWEYEAKTFEFHGIKRGTRFYTPDFLVRFKSGAYEWHEVKGWMDQPSKTRLSRMAKYYPQEKVVVIDETWFRAVKKKGLPALIRGWENNGKGSRGC